METKLTFLLTRPAKSKGGDRYEHGTKGNEDFIAIYLPQSITRKGGDIKKRFTITISD